MAAAVHDTARLAWASFCVIGHMLLVPVPHGAPTSAACVQSLRIMARDWALVQRPAAWHYGVPDRCGTYCRMRYRLLYVLQYILQHGWYHEYQQCCLLASQEVVMDLEVHHGARAWKAHVGYRLAGCCQQGVA